MKKLFSFPTFKKMLGMKSENVGPVAALSDPNSWMTRAFGYKSSTGIQVSESTAMFNSAVFGCQRGISESIALIPRDIYIKTDTGREEVSNHPSSRLLTLEANPLMTSFVFFRTMIYHILSSGNGYAELQFQRGTGKVVGLWPLPPTRVQPENVINEAGELDIIYHITLPEGKRITLNKGQILHVPGLAYDGIRGYSVIQLMANAIGLGTAIEEFGSLFFKHGADLPGHVSVPDDFTEEQIINLKKHNEIQNGGLENMHRWKFLYESAKFVPSGAKPEESQMLGSRIFQIQEIARFHRYPLHKLQELSKSPNYSSLEQFNVEFLNDCLMPWIVLLEQELNRKLFTDPSDEGKYIKFNVNSYLRGDSTARANFYRTMVMSGIMTANEARALEDLPPIEGGDERLVPLNMIDPANPAGSTTNKALDAKQRIQD